MWLFYPELHQRNHKLNDAQNVFDLIFPIFSLPSGTIDL